MPEGFERVFRSACAAGARAGAAVTPPLMIVTDANKIHLPASNSQVPGLWLVPDGPSGMAMIILQPATHRFSRWLLKQGHAQRVYGRPGVVVFAEGESQSIHRAAAYAIAFTSVIELENYGVRAEIVLRYN